MSGAGVTPTNARGGLLATLADLPPELAEVARSRVRTTEYAPGETLIREDDVNTRLYVIQSGTVEIVKQGQEDDGSSYRIAVRGPGEQLGEMSIADGLPVSATVRALTAVVAESMDFSGMERDPDLIQLHDATLRGVVRKLAGRLRDNSQLNVEKLESELRLQRLRGTIARFIVMILTLFSLYTFFLRIVADMGAHDWVIVFGSPLVITVFAVAVLFMIRTSPLPPRMFELTRRGAGAAVRDALVWSAIFLAALTILKALAVNLLEAHQG